MTDWTPPPPGDRREQLPAHLLALVNIPPYTSTACEMAGLLDAAADEYQDRADGIAAWIDRLHSRCRLNNKYTGASCDCACHREGPRP